MGSFKIQGGCRLSGEIVPQGAKNEAMQIICAALLTEEKVCITNLPDIRDINKLLDLIKNMGAVVNRTSPHEVSIEARNIDFGYFESGDFGREAAQLRGSLMIIGPLLARFGKAYMPKPGGDKIGRRRLDTHVIGLQKLGAIFDYMHDKVTEATAPKGLHGTYMLLDEASVTGTANIVMAASLVEDTTTNFNTACEP